MKSKEQPNIDVQFWDQLFVKGTMPWDRRGSPKQLEQFLETQSTSERTVFIPGCGAAYEVLSFVKHEHSVVAMDYSEEAACLAKETLGRYGHLVHHGDVFKTKFSEPFDWIYERAFLAALPRDKWDDYFSMVERLIVSGGLLVGYFVVSDDYRSRFPPFCLRTDELKQRLMPGFTLIESNPVEDSVEVFAGKEYWMVWQKN
ncbi:methyltransferase domain-containing protein [Vibrio sp. HN007]|uniref:methyltransferase domain-containing protein n=1 Tax=Vibrio iocasae TaxID=3098914 RepID=UPI0035D45DD6